MLASMSPPADTTATGMPAVPLLVFVGPPGVGKSSAARELTRLLDEAAVSYACVDRDEFGGGGLLHEDPLLGLNEMLHVRVAGGAQRLVVAWRVETPMDITRLRTALGWTNVTICRLHADPLVLLDRIAANHESFQCMHLQTMALEIAPRLASQTEEDFVLATDSAPARAVAMRALRRWGPLPVAAPAIADAAASAASAASADASVSAA
jgi:DNA polymerase III delta prime subunit